jgi:hypothetical protein
METPPTVDCTSEVQARDHSQSILEAPDNFSLDQALRMWSSGTQQKNGRKVRFSDQVDIREIPTLQELSFMDFFALYMSKRDFDQIERDIAMLILQSKKQREENGGSSSSSSHDEEQMNATAALDDGGNDDTGSDSLRGLEMWLDSSRQEEAVSIVRKALQYQSCGHPDLMAAMYRNCATPCVHAAYMTALGDEQQALSGVLSA